MAGDPVNFRVIVTRYVGDGTGNLTLAVKACRLCLVRLIVRGSLPHITVVYHLALIAAHDNDAVCGYRLIRILARKFRIQIRVFLLYFNVIGQILVVLKQFLNRIVFTALLYDVVQGNILIQIL